MKNRFLPLVLLLVVVLLSNCRDRGFYAPDYEQKVADHQIVAVLPVQNLMLGKRPNGLSQAEIMELEEAESLAFQYSMARSILRADARKRNRRLVIRVQPVDSTNRLLQENDIDIRQAWVDNPVKLAEILGVDAVVSTRIEKYRYFSDLASYGINLANNVIFAITSGAVPLFFNPNNKDIFMDCEIIDGSDGQVLWAYSRENGADWRSPANQIIDQMTWRTAKRFPYLEKNR